MVHPVGKTIPEVQKAYLAGFIDGDGAIVALLERHPAKRFGFRVRIWVKASQLRRQDVAWLRDELGSGTRNRLRRRSERDSWMGRCIGRSECPIERTASEYGGNDPGIRLP